ncbi:4'-phosphopantetheinyl transferase [Hymenopellis radicata]|nr:4'-phosphopantetheinyl transferase [Hymenopellis radicata]
MIFGLGVDLVFVPRIAALIQRRGSQKLASRILSPHEVAFLPSEHDEPSRVRFLAVRWAVKEAAYKALYPVIKPTWKDLTFIPFGGDYVGSKPYLRLTADRRGVVGDIFASVSHDGEYVMASVIAMAKEK